MPRTLSGRPESFTLASPGFESKDTLVKQSWVVSSHGSPRKKGRERERTGQRLHAQPDRAPPPSQPLLTL
eukprot:scaffold301587_cov17-Tisochrysis_lutea.AAC.1